MEQWLIIFLHKMMGEGVAKVFLGHCMFSYFYLQETNAKECILTSFKVQEDDVKMREAFFQEWDLISEGKTTYRFKPLHIQVGIW